MNSASAWHIITRKHAHTLATIALVGALLTTIAPQGVARAAAVHVRVQGHIVAIAAHQIKVRDRLSVVHMVMLTSVTTYWYKLEARSARDLKMDMRVYVLGTANKDGSIAALKIHLYYSKAKKTAGAHG